MPALVVEHLQRDGLSPVSLKVEAGQTLALHGTSGSGKTLLLRALADLDPNQGEVTLGERHRSRLPAHRWRGLLMYVPPESHWWAETVDAHASSWDQDMLHRLGFDSSVLGWEIRRLSSGEKQRLALVRALSASPAGLLLDEPSANLDQENTLKVEQLVRSYQQTHHAPVIWVSHDPAQRDRVARQVARMVGGRLQ